MLPKFVECSFECIYILEFVDTKVYMNVLVASSSAQIFTKPDPVLLTLDFEWFVCIFACPLWASKQVRVLF